MSLYFSASLAAESLPAGSADGWVPVCPVERIPLGGGVAALVGGRQVAVFRTDDGGVYALDNLDPFTGANVLSRGIVGARGGTPTVASPLRKQRFCLATGHCLDDPAVAVACHDVQAVDGFVEVRIVDPVARDRHDTSA